MTQKKPSASALLRQCATQLRQQDNMTTNHLKAQERLIAVLLKRVEKSERRIRRLSRQLSNHAGSHSQRKYKRYVSHRMSPAEKSHLCEEWGKYRHDPDKLAAAGKRLATRYKLDYQRQVQRMFRVFEKMTAAQRRRVVV